MSDSAGVDFSKSEPRTGFGPDGSNTAFSVAEHPDDASSRQVLALLPPN